MRKTDFTTGPRDELWTMLEDFGLQPSLSRARADTVVDVSWMAPTYLDKRELPAHGLKFHVSGTVINAVELMRRVVPFLLEGRYCFKTASSLEFITMLNAGFLGITQVGKLVTVYPRDERELHVLADALVELTEPFDGPFVPSDYKLDRRGCVYYRYGMIAGADGAGPDEDRDFEDTRSPVRPVPDWVHDPLHARRDEVALATLPADLVILEPLRQRGKGGVFRAVQLHREEDGARPSVRKVILKEGRRMGEVNRHGADARERLRWQYRCLRTLSGSPHFPQAVDLFSIQDDLYLLMDDVGGRNLNACILEDALGTTDIIRVLQQVHAAMLAAHATGITLCDLSPDNVLVADDGRVFVSDLEDSAGPGAPVNGGLGTPGFYPPDALRDGHVRAARDYYSLGAIAYALCDPEWYRRCKAAGADMTVWWDRPGLPDSVHEALRALVAACLVDPGHFDVSRAEGALAALSKAVDGEHDAA